jgi:glycosyltransferase involved in cell wall biosynthesis
VKALPKIFVAAHVTKTYGPVQALLSYLKESKADFHFVHLPFSYADLPSAWEERFWGGKLQETQRGHRSRGFDPILWMQDFFFAFSRGWAAGAGKPVECFIGVDSLNATVGVLLKAFGRVRHVAFYVIDYTPQRFGNPLLNAIYHFFDRIAVSRSDWVWNLSERMREVRKSQGLPDARNLLVPVGVSLEQVKHPKRSEIRPESLLYMGAIDRGKGIELLIEAFPLIKRRVPKAKLEIIGYGPTEAEIKALVAKSPAKTSIRMPGGVGHEKLFREVPRFGVAFAPYLDAPGSYTWWCDPTKPKEYLACGLPLIITKVPWIWERIASKEKPMGIAIEYKLEELVEASVKLLKDKAFYWRCRKNALEFASGLSWTKIYDRAFKESYAAL